MLPLQTIAIKSRTANQGRRYRNCKTNPVGNTNLTQTRERNRLKYETYKKLAEIVICANLKIINMQHFLQFIESFFTHFIPDGPDTRFGNTTALLDVLFYIETLIDLDIINHFEEFQAGIL
jgi:hypothetical protein